jgi:hypothetical protein
MGEIVKQRQLNEKIRYGAVQDLGFYETRLISKFSKKHLSWYEIKIKKILLVLLLTNIEQKESRIVFIWLAFKVNFTVERTFAEADLCRSGPLPKRTFAEADLCRSGPLPKRTFAEVHFPRNVEYNKNVKYNKLVEIYI